LKYGIFWQEAENQAISGMKSDLGPRGMCVDSYQNNSICKGTADAPVGILANIVFKRCCRHGATETTERNADGRRYGELTVNFFDMHAASEVEQKFCLVTQTPRKCHANAIEASRRTVTIYLSLFKPSLLSDEGTMHERIAYAHVCAVARFLVEKLKLSWHCAGS
jgi:hypothetical protein